MSGGEIDTFEVKPGLLDHWRIPSEGLVYVSAIMRRGRDDAREHFLWTHLESTTKVSVRRGFKTRLDAETDAQDRAKLYGAIYASHLASVAVSGVSK